MKWAYTRERSKYRITVQVDNTQNSKGCVFVALFTELFHKDFLSLVRMTCSLKYVLVFLCIPSFFDPSYFLQINLGRTLILQILLMLLGEGHLGPSRSKGDEFDSH